MPSGLSPCALCHARVAACVWGPNLPSAGTPTIFCHATTSGPLEPRATCACGVEGGPAGVGTETGMVVIPGMLLGAGTAGADGTALVVNEVSALLHVSGPTTPSGARPCAACHALVAASVLGPKMPSDFAP